MSDNQFDNERNFYVNDPWQYAAKWMMLTLTALLQLSDNTLSKMSQAIQDYAESELARTRIHEIMPVANRRHTRSTRVATKIGVVIVGAVTFSSGMRIFTASWGRLSLPAALLGGFAASLCVDFLATHALFSLIRRLSTEKLLKNLDSQKQVAVAPEGQDKTNKLVILFYDRQIALVKQIEGSNLMRQIPVNAIFACIFSFLEFRIASWIVNQIEIFEGFPVFLVWIASLLPVIVTWAASAFQAAVFDLPEYYGDLIPQYEPFLMEINSPQMADFWEKKSFGWGCLDAEIQFILDGDPSGELKNVAMARAKYKIEYFQKKIERLERERAKKISQRWEAFKDERDGLRQEAATAIPSVKKKNLSPQQLRQEQERIKKQRQAKAEEEILKRERRCQEDIAAIDVDYQDEIQRQQRNIDRAEADYQAARENWKREDFEKWA